MTQQLINIGAGPNDGTGDQLRVSFDKCNQNFTELYTTGAATATEGIWNFNQTSTDTTTSPASGRFRTNSGNAATATQFAIHKISINGFDRADTLRTQHPGDIIKLQDKANADSWARFIVQAVPIDNVDWFQINVAFDSGGGTPPGNNQEILFTFAASSGGGGGGGNVSNSGTPTNGQLAQWTDATHIQGIDATTLSYAPLASPTFTGDPKAPTPATADNDTSIATTAFVKAQGYLTGNQTVTLSGDITGAGTTAIAATIANDAVSNVKLANMTAPAFKGRTTAGTGDPEDLTGTQATTLLDVVTSSLKGLAPPSGGGTANFLRADATWAAPTSGGVAISIQKFTVSGTYTPIAGLAYAIVECIGGGGAGGGVPSVNANVVAAGGGAGGYSRALKSAAQIGASQTITIGAGGTGVSNANGNAGGDTSVGALCIAKGGGGGTVGTTSVPFALGGAGGVAGTGDIVAAGAPGIGGFYASTGGGTANVGSGGSSFFGGGAVAPGLIGGTTAGIAAGNYGSGGSGATCAVAGVAGTGGNGSAGIVIITEYK